MGTSDKRFNVIGEIAKGSQFACIGNEPLRLDATGSNAVVATDNRYFEIHGISRPAEIEGWLFVQLHSNNVSFRPPKGATVTLDGTKTLTNPGLLATPAFFLSGDTL